MTKLTKTQKQDLRKMKAIDPDVHLFSFPESGVTVGIERTGGTMGRFAVAIAAADEDKFRRKVGEFTVMERFGTRATLPVVLGDFELFAADDMAYTAENIANAIV